MRRDRRWRDLGPGEDKEGGRIKFKGQKKCQRNTSAVRTAPSLTARQTNAAWEAGKVSRGFINFLPGNVHIGSLLHPISCKAQYLLLAGVEGLCGVEIIVLTLTLQHRACPLDPSRPASVLAPPLQPGSRKYLGRFL